ncbi:MAG: TetR/AcrR family transcriptional regulator [Ruminococcus sp.]|nr:TetR/AcrR family transcriptional regulator [Ruminococcus sp.]
MEKNKKERIIDAAQQLMYQMPDKEITVSMIAAKAGIGKGSIYYYFESKENIIDAVISHSYKKVLHDFFENLQTESSALEKIKLLFRSIVKEEIYDQQKNFILTLHLQEDMRLHNQMKMVAIQEIAPVLTVLLQQGCAEGSIETETPKESAEIIVAVLTIFLDNTIFPEDGNMQKKLKIFANVLDTCLHATSGSFDFLWDSEIN